MRWLLARGNPQRARPTLRHATARTSVTRPGAQRFAWLHRLCADPEVSVSKLPQDRVHAGLIAVTLRFKPLQNIDVDAQRDLLLTRRHG